MDGKITPRIILASTSPRRKELLAFLRLPFEVVPSHADESTPESWTPQQIVETLAARKAQAVVNTVTQSKEAGLVIGSDTIVVLDGSVLGKPADHADAVRMLTALQGRTHRVYTGVACIHTGTGEVLVRHRQTEVTMKPLSQEQIVAYVNTGEPSDKAGAYGIQGMGATLVESIQGCYFNVVGLPLSLLSDMLSDFGVNVLRP
ncbi:Maf family protein [Paenibacillus sp. FSL M8-0228]|jgi:septum formation protein|uniref:dTTP/UTP pyrophosphatase n=1 Tax=Paenibacillus polymyxa TaxID=1406 RepID=A0A8I1LVE1_PAEPO|nr:MULTISPECIES: Maf family protein [Paenibacillus]KAF6573077.1 septum formation inhibitor Maf [Paenibacillus sp. EKM206P]KAF6587460.1 septum formation inhibitor Maf [Paenibacillus sp. EKM205P]KEO77800.1 septum formation protein Maf [Paenibacillus polymyxa]MBM0633642.1 septum formation inhibitor Maf [Paenibacillus polymyxa]MBO3285904.1 septum formation inhibitor Maf [Paenibacillus polymyxa]